MINNNIPTAENRDIKSLNGGRKITVDGKMIDVISGYSSAWQESIPTALLHGITVLFRS